MEQIHQTNSTNDDNHINNVNSNNNPKGKNKGVDRQLSLCSSISASTLTTSASTSVLTSSAVAYGRGAYMPHSHSYENSVLTVHSTGLNKKVLNSKKSNNNNNNNDKNKGKNDE